MKMLKYEKTKHVKISFFFLIYSWPNYRCVLYNMKCVKCFTVGRGESNASCVTSKVIVWFLVLPQLETKE